MTSDDFALLALQITVMLAAALLFGQLMRRLGQPAVLGEMIGGIVLGPTLLGALAPDLQQQLFRSEANVTTAREAFIKLGMLFFMFLAGLEIDLRNLQRLARSVVIGSLGTLLPLGIGVALGLGLPRAFWGAPARAHPLAFAVFIGMAFANSANPVIARILLDLNLLRAEIGRLIMTATIVDDLVNWGLFAIVLGSVAPSAVPAGSLSLNLGLVVLFLIVVLGGGRWLGPGLLQWSRADFPWPTGFIAVTALAVLLGGAVAERLGLHAFFGAFVVGAALGGDREETAEGREAINHFVLSFFAPVYFVSVGLTTDFAAHFDPAMVALVLAAACVSKIGAVLLAVRGVGMPLDRRAWAIGFGLNARGATGIILATVALEHGLIDQTVFVALIAMAWVTSLMSGPALRQLLLRQATAPEAATEAPRV